MAGRKLSGITGLIINNSCLPLTTMKIKSIIILTILLCISIASSAQDLTPYSTTGQIIQHTYYTLSYSEDHEQAEWVFYQLTPALVNGTTPRIDDFRPDPLVSTGSAQLSDYRGSGFDRGHLCPAGDMKLNQTSMSESFYMSNMSPQVAGFNRGVWKKLEGLVRNWAITESRIYVVTGGILTSSDNSIGAKKSQCPESISRSYMTPQGMRR